MSNEGKIYRISGPVVTATGINAKMYDVVRVGDEGLMGEVIELHGEKSVIQVYEDTSGIRPGEPVTNTGETLSVALGPGLLTEIYDGIQRPLEALEEKMGVFITRGVDADGIVMDKKWEFTATVAAGDEVSSGQVIGTVQETETIEHNHLDYLAESMSTLERWVNACVTLVLWHMLGCAQGCRVQCLPCGSLISTQRSGAYLLQLSSVGRPPLPLNMSRRPASYMYMHDRAHPHYLLQTCLLP